MPAFRLVIYRGWFYAAWREHGSARRSALRTQNRETAERALRAFAAQYEIINRPIITVEFVWNGYRETLLGRPSWATMGFEGRALIEFFANMEAASVSEHDCRAYCEIRRMAGRRDGTISLELGRLRSALIWAERKQLIARVPYIWRPPASPPRDLRLTREQSALFLASCRAPHVRLFTILALTTGARMGALLGLLWARVNFTGRLIDLADPGKPRTKKGRAVVPINNTLMAALTEARRMALTDYVIEWNGMPVKSIKVGLATAGRLCGLPWVTAHVLRHSAACRMAEAGVSMDRIAAFLGHSDSRITSRVYARFAPDFLRDAAEALEI